MKRSNVWLTVDWDYFCLEQEDWKWAHAEGEPFYREIWEVRLAAAMAKGLDLQSAASLRHAAPTPEVFWKTLTGLGYDFSHVKAIVVGDSHRHGNEVFRRSSCEGPSLRETTLVSFDAHHDLTYDMRRFEVEATAQHVTCENWLLMTHLTQLHLRSLIVYPEWKGLRDWERTFGDWKMPQLKESLARYTEPCVWPDPRVGAAAGEVELVYICRSSAWSPPWHDPAFRSFVEVLHRQSGVEVNTPFADSIHPLVFRELDFKNVERMARFEGIAQLANQLEASSGPRRRKISELTL